VRIPRRGPLEQSISINCPKPWWMKRRMKILVGTKSSVFQEFLSRRRRRPKPIDIAFGNDQTTSTTKCFLSRFHFFDWSALHFSFSIGVALHSAPSVVVCTHIVRILLTCQIN
jgi:hypothetical protein